jgi:biopolymer transport protein ExbD
MARFRKMRRTSEEEPDLNMIPIMNLFMVLIPFLLTSVSFFHIKAINTSIPVHAESSSKTIESAEKSKVTVVVEIKANQFRISTLSDTPNDLQLSDNEAVFPKEKGATFSVAAVAEHLKYLKKHYPASDTMILIPDNQITYREIIEAMDCARTYQSEVLFSNVVLSGSLG